MFGATFCQKAKVNSLRIGQHVTNNSLIIGLKRHTQHITRNQYSYVLEHQTYVISEYVGCEELFCRNTREQPKELFTPNIFTYNVPKPIEYVGVLISRNMFGASF